jgi:DNA repair exonuclease SbcCD ATPase subunit
MSDRPASIRALDEALSVKREELDIARSELADFEEFYSDQIKEHADLRAALGAARNDLSDIEEAYRSLRWPVPIDVREPSDAGGES